MLKAFLGSTLIALGIILGFWLGVKVLFIGGIVQVINGVKANPTSAMDIAVGLAKFVSSGFVGWVSFIICFTLGITILTD